MCASSSKASTSRLFSGTLNEPAPSTVSVGMIGPLRSHQIIGARSDSQRSCPAKSAPVGRGDAPLFLRGGLGGVSGRGNEIADDRAVGQFPDPHLAIPTPRSDPRTIRADGGGKSLVAQSGECPYRAPILSPESHGAVGRAGHE